MTQLNPTLDEEKLFCISQVQGYGDSLRSLVLSGTTASERASWPTKGRIASNILKGVAHEAEIATVQVEVDARQLGETVSELAQKQFGKSLALMTVDNTISGLTSRAVIAIQSAKTSDELKVIFSEIRRQHKEAKTAIISQLRGS